MKTIGMIGGTSWLSSAEYYAHINKGVNARLGELNFARCVLYSVSMSDVGKYAEIEDWDGLGDFLIDIANRIIGAGAECLLICANTPHIAADKVEAAISVPLLHIADASASAITARGFDKVALLGTKFTMEKDFYRDRLTGHGIDSIIPDDDDRAYIHETIFSELSKDEFRPETKQRYLDIMEKLKAQGAQGVILGCTEIPLLVKQEDIDLPLFDTVALHAEMAVEFALSD